MVFRLPVETPAALAPLHSRVSEIVGPLRGMVDEIEISEKLTQLSLCLRALFPTGAEDRFRAYAASRKRR